MQRKIKLIKLKQLLFIFVLITVYQLPITKCLADSITLNEVKRAYRHGNYKEAISVGEAFLTIDPDTKPDEEIYYFLALSYLKKRNYLKAFDIFSIIINEYPNSRFMDRAILGLGDVYYLQKDYKNAIAVYRMFPSKVSRSIAYPLYYFKIARCAIKLGKWKAAESNLNIIKNKYPFSRQAQQAEELLKKDFHFIIQVGAFRNKKNAEELLKKLKDENYDVYITEEKVSDKIFYKVKIGRYTDMQRAKKIANSLSEKGYPAQIYP